VRGVLIIIVLIVICSCRKGVVKPPENHEGKDIKSLANTDEKAKIYKFITTPEVHEVTDFKKTDPNLKNEKWLYLQRSKVIKKYGNDFLNVLLNDPHSYFPIEYIRIYVDGEHEKSVLLNQSHNHLESDERDPKESPSVLEIVIPKTKDEGSSLEEEMDILEESLEEKTP
jgi:hypothetical protein